MPTDEDVLTGLIDGLQRQANSGDVGTHIDVRGGAAVADRNSRIFAEGADMSNATVNINTNIVHEDTAAEAVARLEVLLEDIQEGSVDGDTVKQVYDWLESNIPLVASTIRVLESVAPYIP